MKIYLAIIVIIISVLSGCSEQDEIKAPGVVDNEISAAAVRPDEQIKNAQITLYDGSVKTVDIMADYIEKYSKQDSALAWGLDVTFFDSQGKVSSKLFADSGFIRESIKYMIANGNVVVINEDSSRLETEQLIWHGKNDKIENDVFVRLYQQGDTLEGIGFEAFRPYKGFKIKKHGKGVFKDMERIEDE
jgi:LPS export ABC transporter protein LptC